QVVALAVLAHHDVGFPLTRVQADVTVLARADARTARQAPQSGYARHHDQPGMRHEIALELAQTERVGDGGPQRTDLVHTPQSGLDRVAQRHCPLVGQPFHHEPRSPAERVQQAVFQEHFSCGHAARTPQVELYFALFADGDPFGQQRTDAEMVIRAAEAISTTHSGRARTNTATRSRSRSLSTMAHTPAARPAASRHRPRVVRPDNERNMPGPTGLGSRVVRARAPAPCARRPWPTYGQRALRW